MELKEKQTEINEPTQTVGTKDEKKTTELCITLHLPLHKASSNAHTHEHPHPHNHTHTGRTKQSSPAHPPPRHPPPLSRSASQQENKSAKQSTQVSRGSVNTAAGKLRVTGVRRNSPGYLPSSICPFQLTDVPIDFPVTFLVFSLLNLHFDRLFFFNYVLCYTCTCFICLSGLYLLLFSITLQFNIFQPPSVCYPSSLTFLPHLRFFSLPLPLLVLTFGLLVCYLLRLTFSH